VRPKAVPRAARADMDTGQDPQVCWVGDRLMFVVGYTPGGAPHGCYADETEDPFGAAEERGGLEPGAGRSYCP
jgi:hypothetical protein